MEENLQLKILDERLQSRISEFCSLCDFKDSDNGPIKGPCKSGNDQQRYVERNWCGWANIHGVHLSSMTLEYVKFTGECEMHYQRKGLNAMKNIMKAVRIKRSEYGLE